MTFSTLASPGVSLQGGGGSGGGAASLPISGNGATVTASTPLVDGTQTWNNAAVTFTGLKFNAAGTSDANSAASSLLMDLQVGGSSRIAIRKDGFVQLNGTGASLAASSCGVGTLGSGIFHNGSNSGGYYLGASADLFLTRRAAANLRFGAADAAAPVAQTLSVQSVVAGTTNIAGANLTITGSQGTGTGAGGSIIFQVAPAGGSGSAQNALVDALTIDSGRNVVIPLADNSSTLRLGGASSGTTFGVDEDGSLLIRRLNSSLFGLAMGSRGGGENALAVGSGTFIGFASVAQPDGDSTLDVRFARAAAGIASLYGTGGTGAALELYEQTAPSAPAANGVRIYAVDNGSGKTQLMALFATGAAQQIAIEP